MAVISLASLSALGSNATGKVVATTTLNPAADPLAYSNQTSSFATFKEEQGIHQAVSLCSLATLIFLYRGLRQNGFTLRLNGVAKHLATPCGFTIPVLFSTNVTVGIIIGLITISWTAVVVASGFLSGSKPCTRSASACIGRLSYVPWILLFVFVFWILAMALEAIALGRVFPAHDGRRTKIMKLARNWGAWDPHPTCASGYTNWAASVKGSWRWTFNLLMAIPVAVTAAGAFMTKLWSAAFLLVAGWLIFVFSVGGENTLDRAPHRYGSDYLRVVMPSRQTYGLAYILPSRRKKFHAIFSPRIEYEHRRTDSVEHHLRNSKKQASMEIPDIQHVLSAFSAACSLKGEDLANLAEWVYQVELVQNDGGPRGFIPYQGLESVEGCLRPNMEMKSPSSAFDSTTLRSNGTHLIGKNLMYALCHAEYIVYERRRELARYQRDKQSKGGTTCRWTEHVSPRCLHNLNRGVLGSDWKARNVDRAYALFPKLRWKWERARVEEGEDTLWKLYGTRGMELDGIEGLLRAVRYVYQMFDSAVDQYWINIANHSNSNSRTTPTVGKTASRNNRTETSSETDYAAVSEELGKVWNECLKDPRVHTVFEALYALTCRERDLGMKCMGTVHRDEWGLEHHWDSTQHRNSVCGETHQGPNQDVTSERSLWCNSPFIAAPLTDSSGHNSGMLPRVQDLVSFQLVWRQAWYNAIIAQLVIMAPNILSAFVSGILQ